MSLSETVFLAHTPAHPLDEHLRAVGHLAEEFASVFGSGDWALPAGRWHDLGKYRPGFQRYIRGPTGDQAHLEESSAGLRVEHSAAGALYAERQYGVAGRVLAYLIAGHHAGLPDYEVGETVRAALKSRLQKAQQERHLEEALAAAVPDDILHIPSPTSSPVGGMPGFHLWARMLFSCLVDADFLDTEQYMNPEQAAQRSDYPSLETLRVQFDAHMEKFSTADGTAPVDCVRQQVLTQCRQTGAQPPGLFSLTVPTGGGKTLSSLAFALKHAVSHRKRRIIYAIPYTSIIEQTADVFRGVFRSLGEVAIEHHSQADVEPQQETAKSRLACENWVPRHPTATPMPVTCRVSTRKPVAD